MKETVFQNYSLVQKLQQLICLCPIQTELIFCDQVPIVKSADFEVPYAYPKNYPDKSTTCIYKPCIKRLNYSNNFTF